VIEALRASIMEPRDHLHISHERAFGIETGSALMKSASTAEFHAHTQANHSTAPSHAAGVGADLGGGRTLAAADFGRADRRLAHPGWFLGGAEMVWIAGPG